MNDLKKTLNEYKLSAKEVLMMMAKRLGYDSIDIKEIIKSKKQIFYKLDFITKHVDLSSIWSTKISKKRFLGNIISKLKHDNEKLDKDMMYDMFLEMMLDDAKNGYTIKTFASNSIYTVKVILHPFDTLESFLLDFGLEEDIS